MVDQLWVMRMQEQTEAKVENDQIIDCGGRGPVCAHRTAQRVEHVEHCQCVRPVGLLVLAASRCGMCWVATGWRHCFPLPDYKRRGCVGCRTAEHRDDNRHRQYTVPLCLGVRDPGIAELRSM